MTPFEAYVNPARRRPGWWRPLIGMAIIVLCWIAGTVLAVFGYAVLNMVTTGALDLRALLDGLAEGGTPGRILLMLLTFSGIWAGVWMAMALLHGQRFSTIFAPGPGHRAGGFVAGMALAAVFVVPSLLAAQIFSQPVRTELQLGTWLWWIAPIAALIFVQAVGEELIFRGYLQQQLAARTRSAIMWAGVPAVLFGLLHFNPELPDGGGYYYIAITLLMGITLAVLVWRTGSLWTAAGLHYGVNVIGLTVIGPESVLSGTQIWAFPKEDMARLFQVDLVTTVVMLLAILSPLGRVFGDGRTNVAADGP